MCNVTQWISVFGAAGSRSQAPNWAPKFAWTIGRPADSIWHSWNEKNSLKSKNSNSCLKNKKWFELKTQFHSKNLKWNFRKFDLNFFENVISYYTILLCYIILILYCTIIYCYVISYYIVLYYIILYFTVLYYTIFYCIVLRYIILYSILIYCITLFYIILYYTIFADNFA